MNFFQIHQSRRLFNGGSSPYHCLGYVFQWLLTATIGSGHTGVNGTTLAFGINTGGGGILIIFIVETERRLRGWVPQSAIIASIGSLLEVEGFPKSMTFTNVPVSVGCHILSEQVRLMRGSHDVASLPVRS